jgi:16S rRNA (adenine1518-N6/adenine1519-N6)-dimethyltransferase
LERRFYAEQGLAGSATHRRHNQQPIGKKNIKDMNIEQLKKKLKDYHITPNFTYGQNFLLDEIVLEDIVDAAGITKDDVVLEIGPGIGNLTEKLCSRAGFVLSVEKDPKFFPILKSVRKEHKDNFRFEIGDILEFDFQSALKNHQRQIGVPISGKSASYKVVANIPYYITGKIIQTLLAAKHKPSAITILTQKEVAQNITAGPGKLSVLAISVQLFGEPKLLMKIPAKSFYPAPKVDSALLAIKLFQKPKYQIDEKKFFKVLKACFAGKRKQLHNTLVNNLKLSKPDADKILEQLKINPAARPQELSIEQWAEMIKKI